VDFELTDDQREIRALTREFAEAEIEPHAAEWDREHRFPRELFGKLAELGLMGACVPEEYGGAGADFLSYILVLEELSRADAGTFLLFARTDPDTPGARGVSAFILDAEHVRITRTEEKLGLNSSVTNDIVVEGAEVGRDRLLHEEGKGFAVAMATLDGGRIGIAAQALGIAQAAYDFARGYALERRQFGKRIADFQAIQHKLADMSMEIDAARLLVYRAAWLKQQAKPHSEEGAKAKLFASEMARRQTAEAIQILGGYGYTKEFPVERYYRDAKITEIYEGTSEIQRLVIARSILGLKERELAAG
jgi:alkylation response protein AidB-like acyl-CoA dehydrogenase